MLVSTLNDEGPPGAALTADDENHLPYQTKRRTRLTRGPRSLSAAIAQIGPKLDDGPPFPSDRLTGTTWTRVFGLSGPNKVLHPAEEFFRFSSFRYVVDEARKNARVTSTELARVLLGDAEVVTRLNRYYYDCPEEELPSMLTCSEAAVAAFNVGWLPHLTADWLLDDGACAALQLINLRFGEGLSAGSAPTCLAVGFGKTFDAVEACIDDTRSRRLKIGARARAALKALRQVCPALDVAPGVPKCRPSSARKRPRSTAVVAQSAAKSLLALELVLASHSKEVRWKVDAASVSFVRELRRLASDLAGLSDVSRSQERIREFGLTLVTLRTGISMADLARRLGGGSFFEVIDVPESDEDFDQEHCEEEVICSIDPDKYARLLSATDAWTLREFGKVCEKDVWMSRFPLEVIADAWIPVDQERLG